jgi:hypothetical protein
MKRTLSLASVVALAGLATFPAAGSIVYDNTNGFANDFSANGWNITGTGGAGVDSFTDYAVADQFVLGASYSIEAINLWLWETPTIPTVDDLTSLDWAIVANNGSASYPFDGSVIASGIDTTPGSYAGTNTEGYSIFDESFNIGSVALTGGATYWLIIDNAVSASGNPIYWDQSDGPSTPAFSLGAAAPGSSYNITTGTDYGACGGSSSCSESFQLLDGSVPEPGTVSLFAVGLFGLGLARWRKTRA